MSGIWPETLSEEVTLEALNKARPFVSRIMSKNPNDVEDVLNDAMIKAAKKIDKFRGDALFSTWFVRIACREALMFLRHRYGSKNQRHFIPGESLSVCPARERSPEEEVIRAEVFSFMHEVASELPRARREAFVDAMNEQPIGDDPGSKARRFHMRSSMKEKLSLRGVARCFV